jgi:hypothetical protein
MRRAIHVSFAAMLAVGLSLGVARAWGLFEVVADVVTGGAYTATHAAADAANNVIRDAKALKVEVERLEATIKALDQHVQDTLSKEGQGIANFANGRIQTIRSLPGQAQATVRSRSAAVQQSVATFSQLAQRLAVATDPKVKAQIRAEAQAAGVGMLQRAARTDAAVAKALAARALKLPCGADAFANPRAALTLLQPASTRLDSLEHTLAGELTGQVHQGLQTATGQLNAELASAKSTAFAGLQSTMQAIDFGLKDLGADVTSLGLLAVEPWRIAEHPLEPIKNTVAKSQRAVADFDSQVQRTAKQFHDNVVARLESALLQAERSEFAILEAQRLSLDVFIGVAQVVACDDGAGTAQLTQATGAQPRPYQATAVAHAPAPERPRPTALWAPDRFNAAFQRFAATHQAVRPHQSIFSSAVARHDESERQLDQVFRNKSPAEVQNARAQVLALLRTKFAQHPELLAAAEHNLDQAITARGAPGGGQPLTRPASVAAPDADRRPGPGGVVR